MPGTVLYSIQEGNEKGRGIMKSCWVFVVVAFVSVTFAGTNPSLATVLSPGGRIMEGVSGSFDPTGFRMTYGPEGEPLFVEEGSIQLEAVPFHEGQDDEGTWYPLGSGVNDWVYAIAVSGSDVYAGGWFTQAGGSPANYIARWDGSSWNPLGGGLNGNVNAIAVSGTDLYVGGAFFQAGGNTANRIARWDGSSWNPIGGGVGGPNSPIVYAIAVSGSDVYVGGSFMLAGVNPVYGIVRWDGSSWHALGSGVGGVTSPGVYAIAVSGSDVYVGGRFTEAGGNPASYIARWDGSSWHALGSDVNHWVHAIVMSGSDMYVGGGFTQAGDNPANRIARWDGSSWHALGSGLNSGVRAIAVSGSDVYVGGLFTNAGGNPTNYIARWVPDPVGTEPPMGEVVPGESPFLQASPNPMTDGTKISFRSMGLSPLTLSIYDTAGRMVRTQDLGTLPAGAHSHYWDGRDGNGSALASGVYFLRLSSPEQQAYARVVLVR
jgi:hypothetical protein